MAEPEPKRQPQTDEEWDRILKNSKCPDKSRCNSYSVITEDGGELEMFFGPGDEDEDEPATSDDVSPDR